MIGSEASTSRLVWKSRRYKVGGVKGVIFTEFLEMLEVRYSETFVDELIDGCVLPSGGAYTAVGTYDHQEMVTLVIALSEKTGIGLRDLLFDFGYHLFGRFLDLYPFCLENARSALDFLEKIEGTIHAEVRKLYPDAQLPRFEITRISADELQMIYSSERHLADLAEGLMRACFAYFGEELVLTREDLPAPVDKTRFTLIRAQ